MTSPTGEPETEAELPSYCSIVRSHRRQHAGGTSLAEWTLPTGAVLPTVYLGAGSIGTATQSKVFIRGSDMGGGVGGLLYSEQAQGTPKPTVTSAATASAGETNTRNENLVQGPKEDQAVCSDPHQGGLNH